MCRLPFRKDHSRKMIPESAQHGFFFFLQEFFWPLNPPHRGYHERNTPLSVGGVDPRIPQGLFSSLPRWSTAELIFQIHGGLCIQVFHPETVGVFYSKPAILGHHPSANLGNSLLSGRSRDHLRRKLFSSRDCKTKISGIRLFKAFLLQNFPH